MRGSLIDHFQKDSSGSINQNGLRVIRGSTPVPGVVPGVPAGQKRRLPRTQVEGGPRGSYHYHRNNHSPHLTRPLPKPSGEDAGQAHPGTAVLPDPDRAESSVMAICKPQQICQLPAIVSEIAFENRSTPAPIRPVAHCGRLKSVESNGREPLLSF
jgi:hypothetical protein